MTDTAAPQSPPAGPDAIRRLLTERDAAAYLGLSPRTLQTWRRTGDGPRFCKLGRAVRYPLPELDAFATGRTRRNTAEGAA